MKNTEKLLEVIGEVDLKYVDEAEKAVIKTSADDIQNITEQDAQPAIVRNITEEEEVMAEHKTANKGIFMKRFLPIAACAVFAFAGIFVAVKFSKDKADILEPGSSDSTVTSSETTATTTEPVETTTTTTTTTATERIDTLMNAEVGEPYVIIKENDVENYFDSINTVEWSPTMPVYESVEEFKSAGERIVQTVGLSYDEMLELLKYYVEKMGQPFDESKVTIGYVDTSTGWKEDGQGNSVPAYDEGSYVEPETIPNELDYSGGTFSIWVNFNGMVSINFGYDTMPLENMLSTSESTSRVIGIGTSPDGDNEMISVPFTEEQMKAVAEEVYQKTSSIFEDAMTAPKLDPHYLSLSEEIIGTDDYRYRRSIEYRVIETGEPKKIFSRCSLDYLFFFPVVGDGGEEMLKRLSQIYLYHKIDPVPLGEYATISQDKAENLLLSGEYIGDKNTPPVKENIAFVGLVYPDSSQTYLSYRSTSISTFHSFGEYDKTLAPYFCFYVEVPNADLNAHGFKYYKTYYVPVF
jgi:hypothetical protein